MTQKNKFKILVSDPLGKAGMAELKRENSFAVDEKTGLTPAELKKVIPQYDAILIRSGTRVTKDIIQAATRLRVIGRAGVGVDNVDLEAATKRGIIVMNTPEGNTTSTAEHTFSMILALARNIPQAFQSVSAGEWKRQKFLGAELNGKVLGVVGFGRIGREVAKRATAFGMSIVAHDPFLSSQIVTDFPVTFKDLKSLIKVADFITVHTPLTADTRHIINRQNLKLCKKGVRLINCARGGIIDEQAILEGIKSGKVAGAALDVFEKEPPGPEHPLLKLRQVISTPHLGAATQEAQENVAIQVVRQVADALMERAIKNAVNLPSLDPETYKVLRPWIVLAERLGSLHSQLFGGKVKTVNVRYGGEAARYGLKPLTLAVMKGMLTPICGETVNFVNASSMAKDRGIVVNESHSNVQEDFSNYIEIEVNANGKETVKANRIMGTIFGREYPRVVRINEFLLDVEPQGRILFIHNEDQPGVVGTVGGILGKNKINIAEMSLGRIKKGKKMLAMTVINVDDDVPAKAVKQMLNFAPILDVKVVSL